MYVVLSFPSGLFFPLARAHTCRRSSCSTKCRGSERGTSELAACPLATSRSSLPETSTPPHACPVATSRSAIGRSPPTRSRYDRPCQLARISSPPGRSGLPISRRGGGRGWQGPRGRASTASTTCGCPATWSRRRGRRCRRQRSSVPPGRRLSFTRLTTSPSRWTCDYHKRTTVKVRAVMTAVCTQRLLLLLLLCDRLF